MLRNSFVFLNGVGYITEKKLWDQGISCWEDFTEANRVPGISPLVKMCHDREIESAEFNLKNRISNYFSERLKPRDCWRLYPEFVNDACFIDIETTGLNSYSDEITVVGISDSRGVKTMVKGINLSEEALLKELSGYKLVLTFFGSVFDLPFLTKKYPRLRFEVPHIDLCFAARRIGLRGGLKAIESHLGMLRKDDISGVDGFEAVRLWLRWEEHGDERALDRLLEYNRADVSNLKTLADIVYERLKAETFKA